MRYVISDIHGRLDKYEDMLGRIGLSDGDELYVIGDVVDRGPDGLKILMDIMERPNIHMLLGNHELMMLRALGLRHPMDKGCDDTATEAKELWYYNGGGITDYEWEYISEQMQHDIIEYLTNLSANIDISVNNIQYKLVHAAPIDLYEAYKDISVESNSPIEYAVWDRETINYFPELPYTVVFGHTPTCYFMDNNPMKIVRFQSGDGRDKWIGIDCGCSSETPAARLACLRLDDMKEYYV